MAQQKIKIVEWISKEEYCDISGFSDGRVRGWIARHWTEGVQYRAHGKTTAINTKEVDKWWSNGGPQASGQEAMESKSDATNTDGKSTRSRSKATRTKRLISPARLSAVTG